jgi:hypothetical protein
MVPDAGNFYPFEPPGPTPAVGSHVVRSKKTLLIRITWSYTRSRDSCCPVHENPYPFESHDPTPAVGSHVARYRKILPIRITWF